MNLLAQLFTAFFRIGGLTFGGGLAQLPMLKYEIVEKRGWLSEEEMIDIYAIGQCTPGIIAINTATFVGYKKAGVMGGIAATAGMVTPSLVIITLVAFCLESILDNVWAQRAIMGIRAVVCALMLNTVLTLGKKTLKGKFAIIICVSAALAAFFTDLPTVAIVIFAGIVGIAAGNAKALRTLSEGGAKDRGGDRP